MEKHDYSREMDAGPVGPAVTVQGSFNSDGKMTPGKLGVDSAVKGANKGNEALNVMFAKKGENMKGDMGKIMKEDYSLIANAGK